MPFKGNNSWITHKMVSVLSALYRSLINCFWCLQFLCFSIFFRFSFVLSKMHNMYNIIFIFQLKFYIDEEYIGTLTTVREIQLIGRGDVYLGGSPIDGVITQGYFGGLTKVSLLKSCYMYFIKRGKR